MQCPASCRKGIVSSNTLGQDSCWKCRTEEAALLPLTPATRQSHAGIGRKGKYILSYRLCTLSSIVINDAPKLRPVYPCNNLFYLNNHPLTSPDANNHLDLIKYLQLSPDTQGQSSEDEGVNVDFARRSSILAGGAGSATAAGTRT